MSDDYYKILGVEKSATEEEIKKAYRRLAHKYHPDKKDGDEAMFKKINEAYQVLSNKEKRSQYDRFGRVFQGQNGAGGFDWRNFNDGGFEFGFDPSTFEDLGNMGDIFDAFFEGFGMKRKRKTYERGSDLELVQEITLEESYNGATKSVRFNTQKSCETCSGVGHDPKEGFTPCSACDSRGEIHEMRKTFFGNFSQVKTCTKCAGAGKIPNSICKKCSGTGRITGEQSVDLKIAPGVDDGQLIKVTKAGEAGVHGSEPGDLYVRIKIKPHKKFKRSGEDLVITESVNLVDFLINRSVEVETISGKNIKVEIPSDFNLGDQLSASGEGMPRLGGFGKGRLLINLDIKVPKKLSGKAKSLLEDLRRELE
ncbi:MAG: molecular chaperone DnaJ [Candidatus Harrisonbacteria bacterium CG10_big_fil_rev_8_21_14_0_10_40_38]|uniref:Chaperone protein DnaJ n=1 Tax=Candidatus Harrisonbacteria bacterium CG10_big_fil_rev_8_21_14_0_10_40_38 TaxID=1974583 RepID=A0A2H0USB7_9BACT|nr:MAG: molecular chaperone DnaJ [Candidatus Harrisonbacteria bacterium CG10_big_fil_rev_8_21_14_0_10_40_38]